MTSMPTDGLDRLLEQAVTTGAVPGAVAVVTGPEHVLYEGAAGRLAIGGPEPVRSDTVFRLASMTKALTSVAALQLVEQGRLDLDAEVASIVPAHGELQVLDGFDGDTPRLRPPLRRATVRELMTHTAGHGYPFTNADLLRFHQLTGAPDPLSGLRASLHAPLVADPGRHWEYGTNTDWLGQVVEAVAGQDLAAYLAGHVLGPLGMADTSFAPDAERRSRLMTMHHRTREGGLEASDFDLPAEPEYWSGGHGLYGTAGDFARLMAALLADGELDGTRILAPETVELAFSDHLRGAPLPEVVRSAVPELMNDVPSLPFAQGWGLGFHLMLEDLPGMRRAGTGDWAGVFNCYFWIDRASGVAGAFFTQVLPFFDGEVVGATLSLEQAVYAGAAERAPA